MAILTGLVIATLIITAVYVGYHAYEASLHEEIKTHSIPIEVEEIQTTAISITSKIKIDLNEQFL